MRAADGERQVDGGNLPESGGQQGRERPQHQRLLLEQARLRHVPGEFKMNKISVRFETNPSTLSLLASTGAQEMQMFVCTSNLSRAQYHYPLNLQTV